MYKEPDYLIEYRRLKKLGPPKCCHTCDFYNNTKMFCFKFNMNPPEEFTQERDSCPDYFEEIPF